MKFTGIASFVLVSLISNVAGAALDVFVPPITSIKPGTVWTVGSHQLVTWDISQAPVNITNKVGFILLRKHNITSPVILAEDFDILLGKIEVTVPLLVNGDDYQLILLGDSGNFSPNFAITGSGLTF